MRILAISDTHGRLNETLGMLSQLGQYDLLIHLGDGITDFQKLRSYINADIICVKGNCDFAEAPAKHILELSGGTKILCCHGHTVGVKSSLDTLAAEAATDGCAAALYGHTHIMSDSTASGVRLINPGSVGYPYGKFGAVEITDDGANVSIGIIIP